MEITNNNNFRSNRVILPDSQIFSVYQVEPSGDMEMIAMGKTIYEANSLITDHVPTIMGQYRLIAMYNDKPVIYSQFHKPIKPKSIPFFSMDFISND